MHDLAGAAGSLTVSTKIASYALRSLPLDLDTGIGDELGKAGNHKVLILTDTAKVGP